MNKIHRFFFKYLSFFYVCFFLNLNNYFFDLKFDKILMYSVFPHFTDKEEVFSTAYKLLKSDKTPDEIAFQI